MQNQLKRTRIYPHEWVIGAVICLLCLAMWFLSNLWHPSFDKVLIGDTGEIVKHYCGTPDEQTTDGNTVHWKYHTGKTDADIEFRDGLVSNKSTN